MEIQLFVADNGKCPYLDNLQWISQMFKAEILKGSVYESLLDLGFRRSGTYFYKNNCPGCHECVPIRLEVDSFKMTTSQKRAWRKNQDITITQKPVRFNPEDFDLYQQYCQWKHASETATEESYINFLIHSAVETIMVRYYHQSTLVGIGWLDVLPKSLSSVYFAFHPEYRKRSLGVFSVLKEIEMARSMQKPLLHMGFWVNNCSVMSYKKNYRPYQLLIDKEWVHFDY